MVPYRIIPYVYCVYENNDECKHTSFRLFSTGHLENANISALAGFAPVKCSPFMYSLYYTLQHC